MENYLTGLLLHFSEVGKDDSCSLELANAGHPAPLLFSTETGEVSELKVEDTNEQYGIIGVEGLPVSFPPVNCCMHTGDVLICFTDGITEAMNKDGDEFGKERLAEVLKENAEKSAVEIKIAIITAYEEFTSGRKPFDDVTLIVLKRTPSKDFLEEI